MDGVSGIAADIGSDTFGFLYSSWPFVWLNAMPCFLAAFDERLQQINWNPFEEGGDSGSDWFEICGS